MAGLLLIDGLNIVRRVYAGIGGEDSHDHAVKALQSAAFTFRRALKSHPGCSHAIAAWDHGGGTWRHRLYPDYKKSRNPMPLDLKLELPKFQEYLRKEMSLASVTVPDVEADDVIASCARRWCEQRGEVCVVVSTDKDLISLHCNQVQIYDIFSNAFRDATWCVQKMGVRPAQVLDLLALMGDRSDDIPGVPHIGPVNAVHLLKRYGTLAAVLDAAPTIEGALGKNLLAGHDMALICRELVSLKDNVQLGTSLSNFRLKAA